MVLRTFTGTSNGVDENTTVTHVAVITSPDTYTDNKSLYHVTYLHVATFRYQQGVAKSFSIAYHSIDMRKKLLRITESAVSWIHRRSPHVKEIVCYIVEPGEESKDFVLRKMMMTDKKGSIQNMQNPPRLERKDNLFRYGTQVPDLYTSPKTKFAS